VGRLSRKREEEADGMERNGGVEIISAVYVFSASHPPLANRTGGHLN